MGSLGNREHALHRAGEVQVLAGIGYPFHLCSSYSPARSGIPEREAAGAAVGIRATMKLVVTSRVALGAALVQSGYDLDSAVDGG